MKKSRPLTILGRPGGNAVAAQHAAKVLIVTNIDGLPLSPMSRRHRSPFEPGGWHRRGARCQFDGWASAAAEAAESAAAARIGQRRIGLIASS
jgi:hypothetical protein